MKQTCVFDENLYKKTALYNEMKYSNGIFNLILGKEFADANIPLKYYSEGVAPACVLRDFNCDLANNGKYPIGSSNNGMGARCITGY